MKLKKGDKVKVMVGKDKGKDGVIDRVYARSGKILVTAVNLYKKHIKKSEKNPQGGRVDVPRPLTVSKVMLICPKCGKPTRIRYDVTKEKKLRVCITCKNTI